MTPLATTTTLQLAGLVALALAAAAGLLFVTDRRRHAVLLAAALIMSPLVLAASITGDNEGSLPPLSVALVFAALLAGVGALTLVGALFVRFPHLVAPAALVALPFRVPLEVGGQSAKLLVPLYLVIAGAVAARCWTAWRRPAELPSLRSPKLLDLAIALVLVLYALQALYSDDISTAVQNMAFFYVPFAVL